MSKLVVLDPGHYSKTAGKRSPGGIYYEYEFNWDMALKMKAHLERCGINVIITRNAADVDSSLEARTNLANSKKADFFLSIHSNAVGDGETWIETARGWSAHIYASGGTAEKFAKTISNNVFPEMTTKYGLKNRGIVVSNYHVVRETTMPAVLIEHAFHTSAADTKLLMSQQFRRDVSRLTCKGVCSQLGIQWVEDKSVVDLTSVATASVTSADYLNVRVQPSTISAVIGVLNPKAKVDIIEKTTSDLYKIGYGASYGYISSKYLTNIIDTNTKKEETTVMANVIKTGVVTASVLNVRAAANSGGNILGTLKNGDTVQIVGVASTGWYQIVFGNTTIAFVSNTYIGSVKNVEVVKEKTITVAELKAQGYTSITL